MAAKLWEVATSNAFSTTLNGTITDTTDTIVLTSVEGLQYPGVIVVDRQDANNVDTPSVREYISYTGISGSSLTGCSRGLGGSTAQAHNSGARVEESLSITHWGDLIDFLQVSHDSSGNLVFPSMATLTNAIVTNSLSVSGASLTGNFPITPVWVIGGAVSLATTYVGKPLPMPQNGKWDFFSAVLRTPASGASLVIDVNKNGTSIFTDQNTRLLISGGGTFISTASIGTQTFSAGDIFSADIDLGGGSGSDLTIIGRAR